MRLPLVLGPVERNVDAPSRAATGKDLDISGQATRCIAIIGAGPAGTVCALELLQGGRRQGQRLEVLLFDGKSFVHPGPRGCNMCAGVISGGLLEQLAGLGAPVPPALIQQHVTGHCFVTRAGGVRIAKQPGAVICTVFRSAGPVGAAADPTRSFDHFLLSRAVRAGARHVNLNVAAVRLPVDRNDVFEVKTTDGARYRADVLVGAFGVNTGLAEQFEQLGFGYRRPQTFQACQADLPLAPGAGRNRGDAEVRIFSLGLPRIRFGALTPKRDYVTVTLIGRHLRRADLEQFLRHPRVRKHFPPDWAPPPRYCHCHPLLPVTAARNPVADRLLIIGDANVSRYLKGGIESAFFTGRLAARMILAGRLSRAELQRGYVRPCHARYRHDNLYGRLLFRGNDVISRVYPLALAGIRLLEQEQRLPDWNDRYHTRILWNIFTGDAPYRLIARDVLAAATAVGALLRLAAGAAGPLSQSRSIRRGP